MNFCNFAKVIIGRCTKDPESIQWWASKENETNINSSVKSSNKSASFRYSFYNSIMNKYPKMHLPYDKFVRQLPRLQNYLTNPKYWKQKTKMGKKGTFLSSFLYKSGTLYHTEKNFITQCMTALDVKIQN